MPNLELQLALRAARHRLVDEFSGRLEPETVERFLTTSFDQLAAIARVQTMLPLLAERYAHDQLTALARIEGHGADTPLALFLCGHNSGRSQMAMGFLRHSAADRVLAWSGGTEPQPEPNPVAVAAMREKGIDISWAHPNPWTAEIIRAADVVVTMGRMDDVPVFDDVAYEQWELPHITGLPLDQVRPVRDEIAQRVRELLTHPRLG